MPALIQLLRNDPDFPRIKLAVMLTLSALAGGGLLIAINLAADEIASHQPNPQTWLVSIFLLLLSAYAQHYALAQMASSLEEALLKQRLLLAARLRYADLGYVEEVASAPTRAILSKDTQIISQAVLPATLLIRSLAVITFILVYLVGLSPVFAVAALTFVVLYLWVQQRFIQSQLASRLGSTWANDQIFFRYVQSLLNGIREIRQNRRASDEAFSQYNRLAGETAQLRRDINLTVVREFTFGYSLLYLMLIVLLVIVPGMIDGWGADTAKLVVAALYLLIELVSTLGHFPALARANAAAEEMSRLDGVIKKSPRFEPGGRIAQDSIKSFSSLKLESLQFRYSGSEHPSAFRLGPLDLTLNSGEWVFLTGANGSGKTTLLEILAGVHTGYSGKLSINGKALEEGDYPFLRELFAVAWPDGLGAYGAPELESRQITQWIDILKLTGKVNFVNGKWMTHNLSSAENKRLVLLKVILEDRPILLLDGITGDQDAEFRQQFYQEILPALKKQGKTLVVVTQDEAYFKQADRVLTLTHGRFTE